MPYVHPVLGALAAAFLLVIGTYGMRSRHRAAYAAPSRSTHRRYAPWAYGAVATVAVLGTASVLLLRDDLHLADSWHFWLGWSTPVLLTGAALTSKRLHRDATAKKVHPWLGLGAMALALVGAMLGLGILP